MTSDSIEQSLSIGALGLIPHTILPRVLRVITGYLGGGLGNQLFDYAALRSLCDRTSARLIIDASLLASTSDSPHSRSFLLNRFPVRAKIRGTLAPASGRLARAVRRFREDLGAARVNRDPKHYDYSELFWRIPPRAIVRGHFLSPRYFKGNEAAIREDLRLPPLSTGSSAHVSCWLDRIRTQLNPVMVHVRRGDLLLPENQWLQLGDIEGYMRSAVEITRAAAPDARFFFFSDDPAWCEAWVSDAGIDAVVVSNQLAGEDSVMDDFRLMLACRHFILPNSGFSWWAAFLSEGDGRRLLPAVWDPRGKIELSEVLQPGWTSIS